MYGKRIVEDQNNNLNLLYSKESGDYNVFKFERNIILCDPDDLTIDVIILNLNKLLCNSLNEKN